MFVNCNGLVIPDAFGESLSIELDEDQSCEIVWAIEHVMAIGIDNVLSLAKSDCDVAEIEFASTIKTLSWSSTNENKCLVVGDESGSIHFIDEKCELLCSHKISNQGIALVKFVEHALGLGLICILRDGTVKGIPKVPVGVIIQLAKSNLELLKSAMHKLELLQCAIPNRGPIVNSFVEYFLDKLVILTLDMNGVISATVMGGFDQFECIESHVVPSTSICVDLSVVVLNNIGCVAVALFADMTIKTFDCVTRELIYSIELGYSATLLSCINISPELSDPSCEMLIIRAQGQGHEQCYFSVHFKQVGDMKHIVCDLGSTCASCEEVYRSSAVSERDLVITVNHMGGKRVAAIGLSRDLVQSCQDIARGISQGLEAGLIVAEDVINKLDSYHACFGFMLALVQMKATPADARIWLKCVDMFDNMTARIKYGQLTPGEVVACCQLILLEPHCTAAELGQVLTSAQAAVEVACQHVGVVYRGGVDDAVIVHDPDHWPSILRRIAHSCSTALALHTAETDYNSSDESAESSTTSSSCEYVGTLCHDGAASCWVKLVREGRLTLASLVMSRHRSEVQLSHIDLIDLLKSVPLDCDYTSYISWVNTDLIPLLSISCSQGTRLTAAVSVELCRTAIRKEAEKHNPFDALLAVDIALQLARQIESLKQIPSSSSTSGGTSAQSDTCFTLIVRDQHWTTDDTTQLHRYLHLQAEVWVTWRSRLSLLDITELDIEGIVFERLWSNSNIDLEQDLKYVVEPTVIRFGNDNCQSLDDLLKRWLDEALSTKVIVADDDDEADDESGAEEAENTSSHMLADDYIKLSKLVSVVKCIAAPAVRAPAILTLLQTSAADALSAEKNRQKRVISSEAQPSEESICSASRLCDMAQAVLATSAITNVIKDALIEAVRLRRIRALAASYNIVNLDPRDVKQLRSAMHMISNTTSRPNAITDAMTLVEAWSSSCVDVSALLSRAIVFRALEAAPVNLNPCDSMPSSTEDELRHHCREFNVKQAMELVNKRKVMAVVEDVCACLTGQLDCITEDISRLASEDSMLASAKHEACLLVNGAIIVSSLYLDECREAGLIKDFTQSSWVNTDMLASLKSMRILQEEFHCYLSLSDFSSGHKCKSVVSTEAVNKVTQQTSGKLPVESASHDPFLSPRDRRLCGILQTSCVYFLHCAMKASLENGAMNLAMAIAREISMESNVGALSLSNAGTVQMTSEDMSLVLDAAMTMCSLHSRQQKRSTTSHAQSFAPVEPFEISRDMLSTAVSLCPMEFIGHTLDLLDGSDLVVSLYQRVDSAATNRSSRPISNESKNSVEVQSCRDKKYAACLTAMGTFKTSEAAYTRDGILMSAAAVMNPLLTFSAKEVLRRRQFGSTVNDINCAPDVEALVNVLQRSENHVLACRVLHSSWHVSASKAQMLRVSMTALSKKLLSYREIDTTLAIACLVTLPHDAMVKELRAAVPSIQSDFSRLRTVAVVGEELARMWDEEALLSVFRVLQENAKWWNTLASLGVKIDSRTFQCPDPSQREACIKAIVPDLMDKSSMNLELVIEYCRQFDVAHEFASLCYIEKVLCSRPSSSPNDSTWKKLFRTAAATVEESSLQKALRSLLTKIHSLDYEKIKFACSWLVESLRDEVDAQSPLDTADLTATYHDKAASIAAEIDTYRRYLDIATFLSGLPIAQECTMSLPGLNDLYRGDMSPAYLIRLPLWQLLEDPWTILETVFKELPDTAAKLTPLCFPLQLDRDEFQCKRIMSLFKCWTAQGSANRNDAVHSAHATSSYHTDISALDRVVEEMQLVMSPCQRIELLKWVCERDKETGGGSSGQKALKIALAIARDMIVSARTGSDDLQMYKDAQLEIQLELTKQRCDHTMKRLIADHKEQFNAILDNPTALVKLVFDILPEICWNWQMRDLAETLDEVCVTDVMSATWSPAVGQQVHLLAEVTSELIKHGAWLASCAESAASADQHAAAVLADVEALRHTAIGQLLSDVDNSTAAGHSSTGVSDLTKGFTMNFWNAAGAGNTSSGASPLVPSAAERRRREDVYLAFAIAVLVCSCSVSSHRLSYVSQLQTVAGGKNAKSMRRMTARSRLRAVQALTFTDRLLSGSSLFSGGSTISLAADHSILNSYLYCLSEMQETRLPCTEDSLMSAMGITQATAAGAASTMTRASTAAPLALVRTWLHDEGDQAEVVELSRDLLVTTAHDGLDIWLTLLTHMLQRGWDRPVVQTLLMLRHSAVFSALLTHAVLGAQVLAAVVRVVLAGVDKLQLVVESEQRRSGVSDALVPPLPAPVGSGGAMPDLNQSVRGSRPQSTVQTSSASAAPKGLSRSLLLVQACDHQGARWEEAPEEVCAALVQAIWLSERGMQLLSVSDAQLQSVVGLLPAAYDRLLAVACSNKSTGPGCGTGGSKGQGQGQGVIVSELAVCTAAEAVHLLIGSTLCLTASSTINSGFSLCSDDTAQYAEFVRHTLHTVHTATALTKAPEPGHILWMVYCSCCSKCAKSAVWAALDALMTANDDKGSGGRGSALLQWLVCQMSACWNTCSQAQVASLHLFSWCLSRYASVTMVGPALVAALCSSPTVRQGLALCAEVLGGRMSSAEKTTLRAILSVSTSASVSSSSPAPAFASTSPTK